MQCIGIALLMISIVAQCYRITFAMHWDCIAYDKHSCAMLWDCIKISIVVQCIRYRHWNCMLMIRIVVQCIGIALLMISIVVQCIGIALL